MNGDKVVIFGHGDIGQRVVKQLRQLNDVSEQIIAIGRSVTSTSAENLRFIKMDLDQSIDGLGWLQDARILYFVPPAKHGIVDTRSRALTAALSEQHVLPQKLVLISTTGVYGDCNGAWLSETHPTHPQTDRGKRRLDAECQWREWSERNAVDLVILRVPGIYARSRLPVARLKSGVPVVRSQECGYSNRIHADDLARIVIAAMHCDYRYEIFNVSDGSPGKISDYLQSAAAVLDLPPLPEISMDEARQQLSDGMLSYLSESRKINNAKMLEQLKVTLRYPDYRVGLRH